MVYVALIRGINVGGNSLIKMDDLKRTFESLGFTSIIPVLASGNIVFEYAKAELAVLKNKIENKLAEQFRLQTIVMLRTGGEILDLVNSAPFKTVVLNSNTRLHITFLAEPEKNSKTVKKLPGKEFQIVRRTKGELCCVVEPSPSAGTPELMRVLEKEFGKQITTRTWNTVQKIGKVIEKLSPVR
jgi:uncharacterized protein (DUF1697 family)